jgi:uncharacterized membrane protein
MRPVGRLQLAAIVAFLLAYSVLSHYSNSEPQARNLGAALALGPMLCAGFVLLWRVSGALAALIGAAAAAFLLLHYWPVLQQNFSLVYLIQEGGFYAILATSFARSLSSGRVPLCTQYADKIHGPLNAQELRYTRQVTVAWTTFFLLNIAVSFSLYEFATLRIWSLFVNFCSLPLILLMFLGEHLVRRQILPQVERGSLIATLRVYLANPP